MHLLPICNLLNVEDKVAFLPPITVNIKPTCSCVCCPEDPPVTLQSKVEASHGRRATQEQVKETHRVIWERIHKAADYKNTTSEFIRRRIKEESGIDLETMRTNNDPITLSQMNRIEEVVRNILDESNISPKPRSKS